MRKSLVFLVFLFMVFFMVGCGDGEPTRLSRSRAVAESIMFIREPRTGLCFATVGVAHKDGLRSASLA